jgi:dTDP-4-dehydrorhamnose 3,5-epimerase
VKFIPTSIPDVLIIEPTVFTDERGFFMEAFHRQRYADAGMHYDFVQDNQSLSMKGTLRGLHYQITHVQGKLVRALKGTIFDVAVDLRSHSPTFGKWVGVTLDAEKKNQLWIPPFFAHGFYVLSEQAEVLYKTTDYYDPSAERCIIWNDPYISIEWPMDEHAPLLLSSKDQQGIGFKQAEVFE